jgi:hypothetical protein
MRHEIPPRGHSGTLAHPSISVGQHIGAPSDPANSKTPIWMFILKNKPGSGKITGNWEALAGHVRHLHTGRLRVRWPRSRAAYHPEAVLSLRAVSKLATGAEHSGSVLGVPSAHESRRGTHRPRPGACLSGGGRDEWSTRHGDERANHASLRRWGSVLCAGQEHRPDVHAWHIEAIRSDRCDWPLQTRACGGKLEDLDRRITVRFPAAQCGRAGGPGRRREHRDRHRHPLVGGGRGQAFTQAMPSLSASSRRFAFIAAVYRELLRFKSVTGVPEVWSWAPTLPTSCG